MNILNPDTNIIASQDSINNKLCPRSGWLTNNTIIIKRLKNEIKYLLWMLMLSLRIIVFATKSMNKGFTSSIGWNLGKNKNWIHLFDPFTSTPIKGTKKRKTIEMIKKGVSSFIIFLFSWIEIKINKKSEIKTKTKCLRNK